MPYEFVNLVALVTALIACFLLGNVFMHSIVRECNSPCKVKFSEGTQEDEFRIDYKDHSLRVWKVAVD